MGGGGGGGNSYRNLGELEEKAKSILESSNKGKRNVFISFAHDDLDEVNLLRGQAKSANTDLEFSDWSVRVPFDSERAAYIKQKITQRIKRASVTLVYISDNTAKSKWVKWEIEKSLELGKGVIAVHSQGKKPSQMPKAISDNNIKVIPWTHEALTKAIQQASPTEG